MREQVCVYMCPWPRIQAALTDEWALNVTYRYDRGEPRTSIKKAEELRAHGLAAGDCIDCHQCVAVCPTGIDIRDGAQLGCIMCGLCIDACDTVMKKVDRPTGLIAYDTDINIDRRAEGKAPIYRIVSPAHAALCRHHRAGRRRHALRAADPELPRHQRAARPQSAVRHPERRLDPQRLYRAPAQQAPRHRTVALDVEGLPDAEVRVVGLDAAIPGKPVIAIGPDQGREVRVLVTVPATSQVDRSTPLTFRATDTATGETAVATDHFVAR